MRHTRIPSGFHGNTCTKFIIKTGTDKYKKGWGQLAYISIALNPHHKHNLLFL
jgi:hypothetical protein